MAVKTLRGQVAIVGAADTAVGKVPQLGATQLCIDAARRALEDAGITKDQVDGLVTCNSMSNPTCITRKQLPSTCKFFRAIASASALGAAL
ncbi:uncharacterized protein METZ01_LOCUS373532, partial [marine metagenome]